MTKLLMSHNDQWTRHPIDDALKAKCDIIEVDVVYSHGKTWASHSKRWFKCFYRATFEYYAQFTPQSKILYIDIKEADVELIRDILTTLQKHSFQGLVLVGGSGGLATRDCAQYLVYWTSLVGNLNIQFLSTFVEGHKIQLVDVYGKIRWWMK